MFFFFTQHIYVNEHLCLSNMNIDNENSISKMKIQIHLAITTFLTNSIR